MTAAAPGVYGLQVGAGAGSPRSVRRVNDRSTHGGNVVIEAGRHSPVVLDDHSMPWLAAIQVAHAALGGDPDMAPEEQTARMSGGVA